MEDRRRAELKRRNIRREAGLRKMTGMWMKIIVIILFVLFLDIKLQLNNMSSVLSDISLVSKTQNKSLMDANLMNASSMNIVEIDYVNNCGMDNVDRPIERDTKQVMETLEELSEDNEIVKEIYLHSERYPEEMLEALANNPEMAYWVLGYTNAENIVTGGFAEKEMMQEYPLFLQWDPRWGYISYGDNSNLGLAGCGPTCLSMVCYYLTGDEALTPDRVAAYSMQNGYYVSGTGTDWNLMADFAEENDITVKQIKLNKQEMQKELDQGHVMICSMSEGDFTAKGHFIVIYGYDVNGFKVNDPNCVARSRQVWAYESIKNQIKGIWAYAYQ